MPNGILLKTCFSCSKENSEWLKSMNKRGVTKSAIINLAINILRPRLSNVEATDASIAEILIIKNS